MARPLREQFAFSTIMLLVPVAAVMTFAAWGSLGGQMDQIRIEARTYGRLIATYLDAVGPLTDAEFNAFAERLDLPYGSVINVRVKGEDKPPLNHWQNYAAVGPEPTLVHVELNARPWVVEVGVPVAEAWRRAAPDTFRTIGISGLATLILLLVQLVFLRRLLPALASLEQSTARVGAGDLSVPFAEPMPSRELEHLRDAFHDMVDKLRAASESIARQMEEEREMRHELESLQQQVVRQERLAAIGVLVSGIAHELNNPLQTISGFSELLQKDPRLGEAARSDLALIHQESARAGAIIRNLSRFGRQQGSTPVPVQLTEVLTSVMELRQRRLSEQNIRVERDERATRPAYAVFTELQQVALNFVINAEQSLRPCDPAARRIILRTRDDQEGVRLEVEDTGAGVSPENEAKLFQPFFTTKPVGDGTGLGLSVSYGIIRSLGGTIGYRRGELDGAVFFFVVPAAESNA